jgi:hypothetical protein
MSDWQHSRDCNWYIENWCIKVNKPWRAFLGEGAPETVCEMNSSLSPQETCDNAQLIIAAPKFLRIVNAILDGAERMGADLRSTLDLSDDDFETLQSLAAMRTPAAS